MGTDQNQSGVKPRMWLATERRAKLGAGWLSPGDTQGLQVHLTDSLQGALAAVDSPRCSLHGVLSPARPPATSTQAPYV